MSFDYLDRKDYTIHEITKKIILYSINLTYQKNWSTPVFCEANGIKRI